MRTPRHATFVAVLAATLRASFDRGGDRPTAVHILARRPGSSSWRADPGPFGGESTPGSRTAHQGTGYTTAVP